VGRGANAAGALSVRQAGAALQNCDAYVGNDTGTMHLARPPESVVWPSWPVDWPGHWNPYGQASRAAPAGPLRRMHAEGL